MARASSRDLLRSASKLAIVAAAAGLLTGCGAFSSAADEGTIPTMASTTSQMTQPDDHDYVAGAAYWGAKFEANHNDINAAVSFARNLRLMGGARQAVTVMKDLVMAHPDNAQVLAEYGKALTACGRSTDAVPFLARASQIDGNDWSTLSAYGVALDQTNSHGQARDNYLAALKLSPNNPVIQSNLALSYLLEGNVAQAEPILRQLVARPDATPQMRQNLAMVESIQGNHGEAEKLVRGDLPQSDADNNLTVLNQLSASNAAVDTQPLPAPQSETPALAPATDASPAALAAPTSDSSANAEAAAAPSADANASSAPVMTMAPIADDPVSAPAATTPAHMATSASAATPVSTTYTTPAGKQIISMAPIADDQKAPGKPAKKKPTATASATPASGTTPATTAAAAPAAPSATMPAATTAPAPATSAKTPAATAPAAPATPTSPSAAATPNATPDSSKTSLRSSQPTDPFRPAHEINVANAAP